MSYDLFFRSHQAANYARDASPAPRFSLAAHAVHLGLAGFAIALPAYLRHRENSYYRRLFATDLPSKTPGPNTRKLLLNTTSELPAIPMSELVYGKPIT